MTRSKFRQLISRHFDAEELKILCFDLDIDYDNLPGERKDLKVIELIDHLRSRKRIPDLVKVLNNARPPIHWEEILPEFEEGKPAYQTSEAVLAAVRYSAANTQRPSLFVVGGFILAVAIFIGGAYFLIWGRDSGEVLPIIAPPPVDISLTSVTLSDGENVVAFIPVETTPTNTITLTKIPPPTLTPIPSATPMLVEPVNLDEYMVLVTEFEHLGGPVQDHARFIVDDLRQQLEVTLPNSRIRIREYDGIITSKQDVLTLADQVEADIVVWGNYDEDGIHIDLQVGSLAGFPDSAFDRDDIAQVMDVRTTLANVREQSLSIPVVTMLAVLAAAESDTPELSRLLTMTDFLPKEPLDFEGNSMAAHYHRALFQFIEDPAQAIVEVDAAILIEQNPLLYMGRGMVYAKLGDVDTAINDWSSAAKLGPDGWFMPQSSISFGASMTGDIETALENANYVVEKQENGDWYGYYLQGVANYMASEHELSATAFQQAIEREPTLNWPYTFAIMVALRQGDIEQAKDLVDIVLHKFPDPTSGIRTLQFSFGDGAIVGHAIAANSNLILGQYADAIANADAVLAVNPMLPDMYFIKGISYCNLGNYVDAEDAYTQGISLDPTYTLLYLLRSEAFYQQGENVAAYTDMEIVMNSPDSIAFFSLVKDAQAGLLSCRTFLRNED